MKGIIKVLSVAGLLTVSVTVRAQDLHFSQFYEMSILRNPALTGIFSGDFKVGADFRQQWSQVSATGAYNTFAGSAEFRVLANRTVGDYVSFGAAAYSDKAGSIDFKSQAVYPTIAYNKALNDRYSSYLSVGFTGGYVFRSVDMSKMTFSSQFNGGFDQSNASGETTPFKSLSHYDLAAGVSLNSSLDAEGRSNFYVGASVYHLNTPTQIFNGGYSSVKLPMKFQGNLGVNMVFSNVVSLALHANYSRQVPYTETIVGGLVSFRNYDRITASSNFAFSLGAFYRANDALIPTVKIDYGSMSLGYSYDATNSSLGTKVVGTGASEISLYIRGKFNHVNNPLDNVNCPRFEPLPNYPFSNN